MEKIIRTVILLLLVWLPAHSLLAQTQEKQKVAVYVTGVGSAGEHKLVGTIVTDAILKNGKYLAVERTFDFLSAINQEQATQRGGSVDIAEISQLGKNFGAQYVCVIDVDIIFDTKYIVGKLINTETVSIENTGYQTGNFSNANELKVIAEKLAQNIFGNSFFSDNTTGKPKLAVYVTGKAEKNMQKLIGAIVTEKILKTEKYLAVERTEDFLTSINKEQSTQRSGSVDVGEISELGKNFGAAYVCVVDVDEALGSKILMAKIINTETVGIENTAYNTNNFDDMATTTEASRVLALQLVGFNEIKCGNLYVAIADEPGFYTWEQAKKVCSDKGNGWYLPSKDELNQLFVNKESIGGFSDGNYLSSTESSSYNAWSQNFYGGFQYSYDSKDNNLRVRCVRRN